jgi:hypothetical protein
MAQLERSDQAPLPPPFVASASDGFAQLAGRPLDLTTAREEHVFGLLECTGGVHTFAESQDGSPQQGPAQRKPARLLLPNRGIPLCHLQQAVEAVAQRRPIRQRAPACRLGDLAFGDQPCPTLGRCRESSLLAEGGPVPVDALDRVGRRAEGDARQAAQQDLGVCAFDASEVGANEAGQAAFHLPRRPAHDRQRPESDAGRPTDRIHQVDQLRWRGGFHCTFPGMRRAGLRLAPRTAQPGARRRAPARCRSEPDRRRPERPRHPGRETPRAASRQDWRPWNQRARSQLA